MASSFFLGSPCPGIIKSISRLIIWSNVFFQPKILAVMGGILFTKTFYVIRVFVEIS